MDGKLVVGLTVVMTLALGACGMSSDDAGASKGSKGEDTEQTSGDDSTTTATGPAVTADPPLAFDVSEPVGVIREEQSKFGTLRGRTAYSIGPDAMHSVDVLTGEEAWEAPLPGAATDPDSDAREIVNGADPRPPVVTDDGKTVVTAAAVSVPGKGTTQGHQTISVLAVETESGEPAWSTDVDVSEEVVGPVPDGADTQVVAVTDGMAVVTYSHKGSTTAAIDVESREVLWQRDDYLAETVVGDVVVGVDSEEHGFSTVVEVAALDLTTGDERWVVAEESGAAMTMRAGERVVVNHTEDQGGDANMLFVDASNGKVLATVPEQPNVDLSNSCLYDERSVLVCSDLHSVTAYTATDGKELWSLSDDTANRVAPRVTAVWHGAVYGEAGDDPVVLDAETGDDLSVDPGLAPMWVSEYAGIATDENFHLVACPVKEP